MSWLNKIFPKNLKELPPIAKFVFGSVPPGRIQMKTERLKKLLVTKTILIVTDAYVLEELEALECIMTKIVLKRR